MINWIKTKLANRYGWPLAWIEDSAGNVWLRVIRHSRPFDSYVCDAGHYDCKLKLGRNGHVTGCPYIDRWKPANEMGEKVEKKIKEVTNGYRSGS